MLDTIQDDSQILELSALVETFQLRQLAAVQDTGADDVDSQVGDTVYNRSIGHHARRDIIHDDVIVTLAEFGEHLVQTVAQQQLSRVGRNRTGLNHIETFNQLVFQDNLVDGSNLIREVVRCPLSLRMGMTGKRTLANIQIDKDDALLHQDKAGSQVRGDERLTGTWIHGGEHHDLHILGTDTHEVHVGADDTEGLGDGIAAATANHHLALLLLVLSRNLAQERDGRRILNFLLRMHLRIHTPYQPDNTGRDSTTQDKGGGQNDD